MRKQATSRLAGRRGVRRRTEAVLAPTQSARTRPPALQATPTPRRERTLCPRPPETRLISSSWSSRILFAVSRFRGVLRFKRASRSQTVPVTAPFEVTLVEDHNGEVTMRMILGWTAPSEG
jgi:hypothetical protein